ncbi:GNAT family N-acetyltransferase [Microbacterium terregens]|uniref:GNAT family N-acetyltransferase n=1 Tax=Microbacterium terregens TaxID=69363 RepID=UPI003CD06636
MAGERLHPAGWTEISAVSTDDAYRRQGLASRLVLDAAFHIQQRETVRSCTRRRRMSERSRHTSVSASRFARARRLPGSAFPDRDEDNRGREDQPCKPSRQRTVARATTSPLRSMQSAVTSKSVSPVTAGAVT